LNYWFTSDTHFNHGKIIEYVNRPFRDAQEMNEMMIYNWNSVVKPQDIVWHMGDFSFGNEEDWVKVRKRLNGHISLIRGNHDKTIPFGLFSWVRDYSVETVRGQKVVMFHYGMRTWWHDIRGVWHIYGHSHNQLPPYGKSCDVGVDAWNFKPVHFDELKKFMDARAIGEHPQFANFKAEQNG
jgi:calcineurin-like phosphoesterase family protein